MNRGAFVLNRPEKMLLWGYVMVCLGAASITTLWEICTKWQWWTLASIEWLPRLLSYMNLYSALCVLMLFTWIAVRHPEKVSRNEMIPTSDN